jgi:hypothetical protein
MFLITAVTADRGGVFPQVLLQFLGIQAMRNPQEVHDIETARRQKAAFIEDLGASVHVQRELATRLNQKPKALRLPNLGAQLLLKATNSAIDGFHVRFSPELTCIFGAPERFMWSPRRLPRKEIT